MTRIPPFNEVTRAGRVARNIIKNHGRAKLRRLIILFRSDESGEVIARELGVSRSRVNQWKHALGTSTREYVVHENAAAVVAEGSVE